MTTRCPHLRTVSYARFVELGGEPVDPAPIGIIDSAVVGWFVCVDCWVLSNDEHELASGNWPTAVDEQQPLPTPPGQMSFFGRKVSVR